SDSSSSTGFAGFGTGGGGFRDDDAGGTSDGFAATRSFSDGADSGGASPSRFAGSASGWCSLSFTSASSDGAESSGSRGEVSSIGRDGGADGRTDFGAGTLLCCVAGTLDI